MTMIPYDTVDPEVLGNLLEEIVTRDGTDYGVVEISTQNKVSAALTGLKNGHTLLIYDEESDSCSLCSPELYLKK